LLRKFAGGVKWAGVAMVARASTPLDCATLAGMYIHAPPIITV
jgi:hypothetical protein